MLSIVIPTIQKNTDILYKLVKELVEDKTIGEIIIIDNSLKGYDFDSTKVKVIIPDENLYVNAAWNLGINNIQNNYFGILNDDIILPQNFCSQVYEFIKNNENIGLVGLDSSIVHNTPLEDFNTYPQNKTLKFRPCEYLLYSRYWGSAIFGRKENYYSIPENLKIWCGDNYLMKKNNDAQKRNYEIIGGNIKHLSSLSSNDPAFKKIKDSDLYNYAQIDKNFKKHGLYKKKISFAEKIFSIRNSDDRIHKIITILGIKYHIKITPKPKVLVHFHLYYHEQIDFWIKKLNNINHCIWDLYVTYIEENEESKNKILNLKPDTIFIKVPNHGFDIMPFIQVLKMVDLKKYDYILKLHTKAYKSNCAKWQRKFGWRDTLVNALLSSKTQFFNCLKIFSKHNNIGMIGTNYSKMSLSQNHHPKDILIYDEVCSKLNLPNTKGNFIAGTMFLCKAPLFELFKNSDFDENYFYVNNPETNMTGTPVHALERLLGTIIEMQGYYIYGVRDIKKELLDYFKDFLQKIFSIKNAKTKSYKIITILGYKYRLVSKHKPKYPKHAQEITKVFNSMIKSNKMAAVFAMHNNNAILDDNLIKYLTELRKYTGYIVLSADHPIISEETEKVKNLVDAIIFKKHNEYDFGSYKRGYLLLKNYGILNNTNNLLFINDSVVFVGNSLEAVFNELKQKDFYGITQNSYGYIKKHKNQVEYDWGYAPHIQSYFVSFSKNIFNKDWFDRFVTNIKQEKIKEDIIFNYEMGLSKLISSKGFELNSFYPPINGDENPCYLHLSPENAEIFIKKSLM